ncbi:MAG: metal-activated pyridoxal enzyme, partial [Myxococcota bacterium]|nr:metal-activated pyridoxal enzyme [Myxococcota bacterium]
LATVISVSEGFAVADCGLKALGMDHGNPSIEGARIWFCSDEHVTFTPEKKVRVGDRIRLVPAHVDPTVAYHERFHVVEGERVVEEWPVDLRGW